MASAMAGRVIEEEKKRDARLIREKIRMNKRGEEERRKYKRSKVTKSEQLIKLLEEAFNRFEQEEEKLFKQ